MFWFSMKTKIELYREEIKRLMTPESMKKKAWQLYEKKQIKPGKEWMIQLMVVVCLETEAWRNAERLYVNQRLSRSLSDTWNFNGAA